MSVATFPGKRGGERSHANRTVPGGTGIVDPNGPPQKEATVVASLDYSPAHSLFADENARIPSELNVQSKVFELKTIGDARDALARLRELRRDFDASTKRGRTTLQRSQRAPKALPGKGEEMLAGLSNIQRMRTIRGEIAYLEDLMVRIAEREFEQEELRHRSYLSGIGQWSERGSRRPVI
jgi:hypothetical protein